MLKETSLLSKLIDLGALEHSRVSALDGWLARSSEKLRYFGRWLENQKPWRQAEII
jgi:hypothetical protein